MIIYINESAIGEYRNVPQNKWIIYNEKHLKRTQKIQQNWWMEKMNEERKNPKKIYMMKLHVFSNPI